MKYLAKLLLPLFRKHLIELISKEENKTFVVSKINEYVDLPNVSEEEEKVIFDKIYDAISELTKAYLSGTNK